MGTRSDRRTTATRVIVHAPAKLNLWLRVLGRRPDGYHELESLFCGVSLWDTLAVERTVAPGCRLTLLGGSPDVPADGRNLVVQAVEKAFESFRPVSDAVRPGVNVRLTKRIPSLSGLGGGSSDAAAALLAVRSLYPGELPADRYREIAAELGSDVNFFLEGHRAAVCSGRGERVQAVRLPTQPAFVIARPPVGLSTARVFRALSAETIDGTMPSIGSKYVQNGFSTQRVGYNHLQQAAFASEPRLREWQQRLVGLTGGRLEWSMTGSGSAMFCTPPTIGSARRIARRVRVVFQIPTFVAVTATPRLLTRGAGRHTEPKPTGASR